MSLGRQVIRILILCKYNIWLKPNWIRLLEPKKRDRATYLNKRWDLRLQIELEIIDVNYLLNFNEIGYISVFIDAPLKIPGTRKPPRPPGNEHKRTILRITPKIKMADIAINHGHNPLFLYQTSVKFFNQVMIPQKVWFKRLVFSENFFWEAVVF